MTKEWLEVFVLTATLIAILCTGLRFVWHQRQASIEKNYQALARKWTNEGEMNSSETIFIDLDLTLENGDLFGLVNSPQFERPYEAHVDPRWFSSTLTIRAPLKIRIFA